MIIYACSDKITLHLKRLNTKIYLLHGPGGPRGGGPRQLGGGRIPIGGPPIPGGGGPGGGPIPGGGGPGGGPIPGGGGPVNKDQINTRICTIKLVTSGTFQDSIPIQICPN